MMGFDAERFINGLHDYLERAFRPVGERLAALEERQAKLEKSLDGRGIRYKGVYQPGQVYEVGDLATFDGGLWHAHELTRSKPGTADSGWRLCVKSAGR